MPDNVINQPLAKPEKIERYGEGEFDAEVSRLKNAIEPLPKISIFCRPAP